MRTLTKLACSLAGAATFAFASVPAHAQFEGTDQMAQFAPMIEQFAPMIEQFAPMMQKMQGRLGKKGTAQMLQMVGPMMSMMAPGGGSPAACRASTASRPCWATARAGLRADPSE
jgi:hypothetical protein